MNREEAIERLKQNKAAAEFYASQSRITAEIENALKDSEAFDMAIEALKTDLVRCKDCRHRDLFSCPLADNNFQKDDDYCSWGERREE